MGATNGRVARACGSVKTPAHYPCQATETPGVRFLTSSSSSSSCYSYLTLTLILVTFSFSFPHPHIDLCILFQVSNPSFISAFFLSPHPTPSPLSQPSHTSLILTTTTTSFSSYSCSFLEICVEGGGDGAERRGMVA